MNIELTKDEVTFLVQVLEQVPFQGSIAAKTYLSILEKLNGNKGNTNSEQNTQVLGEQK
jgi:hypothetical protein